MRKTPDPAKEDTCVEAAVFCPKTAKTPNTLKRHYRSFLGVLQVFVNRIVWSAQGGDVSDPP
jgi:hypothetical protein